MKTDRLVLRNFSTDDLPDLIKLNQNPQVMQFFPNILTVQQSTEMLENFTQYIWAVELQDTAQFIGFVGLNQVNMPQIVSPVLEILWRFHPNFWHKGYATEAALAILNYAFDVLKQNKVIAFTAVQNQASENLMKRLGMQKKGYFNHPALSVDHYLSKHILYEVFMTSIKL